MTYSKTNFSESVLLSKGILVYVENPSTTTALIANFIQEQNVPNENQDSIIIVVIIGSIIFLFFEGNKNYFEIICWWKIVFRLVVLSDNGFQFLLFFFC